MALELEEVHIGDGGGLEVEEKCVLEVLELGGGLMLVRFGWWNGMPLLASPMVFWWRGDMEEVY